jgi:hypothetical protein
VTGKLIQLSFTNEPNSAGEFNEETTFCEKLLRIAARICSPRFHFFLPGNFANGFFQQCTLLFAGLALHASHVEEGEQNRQSGKYKTHHPINNEWDFAQGLPQKSFAKNQHEQGNHQKSHAAFAMSDAVRTFHALKIAPKLFLAAKFLAGISRIGKPI